MELFQLCLQDFVNDLLNVAMLGLNGANWGDKTPTFAAAKVEATAGTLDYAFEA